VDTGAKRCDKIKAKIIENNRVLVKILTRIKKIQSGILVGCYIW